MKQSNIFFCEYVIYAFVLHTHSPRIHCNIIKNGNTFMNKKSTKLQLFKSTTYHELTMNNIYFYSIY